MARKDQRGAWVANHFEAIGSVEVVNTKNVTVHFKNGAGKIMLASVASADLASMASQSVFAKGALLIVSDAGAGVKALYENSGTAASSTFNAVGDITAGEITLNNGQILAGNGSNVAAGVTPSGDMTMTNTGVFTLAAGVVSGRMAIYNDTGGTLTKGTLVRIKGYDTTNGVTVEKADADSNKPATHVIAADILNAAAGTAQTVATVTDLATNGQTIGDPVYLSGTAGGFTFIAPTGANQLQQQVGVVKVVHATTGEIVFFPGAIQMLKVGTDYMQDLSVSTTKIAASAVTGSKVTNGAIGALAHLDLAVFEVDHAAASPLEILAADADEERLALVTLVATEAAAGDPDIDIGVASDANSVVDDFGAGAWVVGDRLVRLIRIPAGDNLRATITAAGTAGKIDVYVHLLTPIMQTTNLANSAVTNPKVADSAGAGGLFVEKSAIVVYDFAVDGGVVGTIPLTGSPTIPDNAVVWVDSYEVVTTLTTAGADAGTLTLGFATDGDLFTAIAVSDLSNPWDQGVFVQGIGALAVASQTPKKLTAARTLQATVGTQNVTAGKVVFHLKYWVSV